MGRLSLHSSSVLGVSAALDSSTLLYIFHPKGNPVIDFPSAIELSKMNIQEWGVLGSIFSKHQYLDSDQRKWIKDLVQGTSRPLLASLQSEHPQSLSLLGEIMELWERKNGRLPTAGFHEAGITPEPNTTSPTHCDPSIDTTRLPDQRPVYKMRRARRYFQQVGKLPPFVIRSRNSITKMAILPSISGLRPENPTRTIELVLRPWDKAHSFWTTDQNGRRYIVQHFARDGGRWQTWRRKELFSSRVLAYSPKSGPHRTQEDDSETESESESSDEPSREQAEQQCLPSGRPLRSCVDLLSIPRDDSTASDSSTSNKSKDLASSRNISPSASFEGLATSKTSTFPRGKTYVGLPYRDQQAKTGTVLGQDAEPNPSDPPTRARAPLQPANTTTSRVSATTRVGLPNRSETTPAAPCQNTITVKVPANAETSKQSPPHLSLPQPSLSTPILAKYKGDRTNMILYVEASGQLRKASKKRLRGCNSIDGFLRDVCERCRITEDSVANLTVTIPWLTDGHQNRHIHVRLKQHSDFMRRLIHEVDNAPCWSDRRAECVLRVDIFQKAGRGFSHIQASLSPLPQH